MPVVNAVIVPVLPDDGEGIRPNGYYITDARGRRIPQLDIEHFRIGFGFHILMPAAAGGAGTGCAQQLKGIDARMIVVPRDGEFSCLFVCSNTSWFFVHYSTLPPLLLGEGRGEGGGEVMVPERKLENQKQPSRRAPDRRVPRDTTMYIHPQCADHPAR